MIPSIYRKYNLWYIVLAAGNACLGVMFFSYNLTIFNALLPFLKKYIFPDYSEFLVVLTATAPLITAGIGAVIAGNLTTRLGRRTLMMITDILAIAGVVLTLIAHYSTFLVGRLLLGFSVGITTVAASLFFTELTPLEYRGEMSNAPNIFSAIGILLAALLGLIVPNHLKPGETDETWRVLLALSMLAPIIRFTNFLFLFRYDTPFFYIYKFKYEKAACILKKIYNGDISARIKEICEERDYMQTNRKIPRWSLMTRKFRKAVFVGILIMSLQYISGLGLILVYTGDIYAVGVSATYYFLPKLLGVTTAMVNFFTAIFSIWTTSQFGRKPLMVGGTFFSGLLLVIYGILAEAISPGHLAPKIFLVVWPIAWGISLGSVLYVIIAETLPDVGVSTATFFNWVFAFVSIQFFHRARDSLGYGWTFIIFGGVTIIGSLLLFEFLVETRGKNKDDILKQYSKTYEATATSEGVSAGRQVPETMQV